MLKEQFMLNIINKNENYKIDNLYNDCLINCTDIFAKCIFILVKIPGLNFDVLFYLHNMCFVYILD